MDTKGLRDALARWPGKCQLLVLMESLTLLVAGYRERRAASQADKWRGFFKTCVHTHTSLQKRLIWLEAAAGSHYESLHNLFSLRMFPNIIYKISVGNALAAEQ